MNLSLLAEQILQQDVLEWAGLFTGVLYVLLATLQRPSCWIFGIISSACIGWKSFTDYILIADGFLQIFYIVIGVIGLWSWIRGSHQGVVKPIITSRESEHFIAIAVCILLSYPLSWLLIHYADARYGYPDTLLTLLSVWATILLIRKDLVNWMYWIVIDAVYIILYWKTAGYLFALLFLVYALVSIWGWRSWKASYRRQKVQSV